MTTLTFEKPLMDIQEKIEELRKISQESGMNLDKEIENFEQQANDYKKELYSNLRPAQKLLIARHPDRPSFLEYVELMCDDFVEMRGDRSGTDDRAILGGLGKIGEQTVMLVGTQKGRTTKENLEYNFGMPQPQGYRKALRLFNYANKFNFPIITLVDTPGAYPGISAEEKGQGTAIAVNLRDMAKLNVPVISVITGEGCSGGALGLAVANKVFMLEYSYYTVISPEGCASILWRDATKISEAATALKIGATDLLKLNIIDGIIKEPVGGAHRDHKKTATTLKNTLIKALSELSELSKEELKVQRYEKFRGMGVFAE